MSYNIFSRNNDDVMLLLSRVKFTFDRCILKLRLVSYRTKKYVALSIFVIFLFYSHPISWLFPDTVTAYESLLQTSKCPACYGSRVCGLFYYGRIKMAGKSRFRTFDYFNSRNIYHAQLAHADVIVKKLAPSNQLAEIDYEICQDVNQKEGCNVSNAFPRYKHVVPFTMNQLTVGALKDTKNKAFLCPSSRFLDTIWTHFQEYDHKNRFSTLDRFKVLYASMVNPEPIILQTFPKSEGWPFPEYLGACGRAIVVENGGEALGSFYHAEFSVRVALAYELMMIAEALTLKSDFALYLTDVSFDNFVVDYNGKVKLVDLEHVVVVDKLDVKARAPDGWEVPHHTKFHDCSDDGNCLDFKTEDLCNHELSDHNYNAVCRHILSPYSTDPDYPGGLLHHMSDEATTVWNLEYHLNACSKPRPLNDRFISKDDVIRALKGIMKGETVFKDMEKKR